jgi:phenylacetate-CoA ligase
MSFRQAIVRHCLYPVALWRSGELAQLQYMREYHRTQFHSPEQLRDLQFLRLRSLLEHAYRNCPFYRARFRQLGLHPDDVRCLEDLRHLPTLEKTEVQQVGDQLVADDQPRDQLVPNQTGGSTGTPVAFFLSRDRLLARTAATLRHNRWAGWELGDRVAVLWGAARDRPRRSRFSWLRERLIDPQLFLDAGHLTEQRLLDFHRRLQRFRPRILLAYARSAVLLAQFLRARGLAPVRLRSVVTSAEVLTAEERALIEGVFACPVFNRYGSREFSVIASECPAHDGLHVMAEGLYLEIVNGDRPARPGEPGAVLVTDLLNHAMPLIRYRIGDVASWLPGACACGRGLPRLREVAGRVTDFLIGGDGRAVSGAFLTIAVVARRASLGQVQVVQERAGAVTYRVKPGPGFSPQEDLQYLVSTTREHLGETTQVGWELVDDLPAQPSGKYQFSRSQVVPAFLRPG